MSELTDNQTSFGHQALAEQFFDHRCKGRTAEVSNEQVRRQEVRPVECGRCHRFALMTSHLEECEGPHIECVSLTRCEGHYYVAEVVDPLLNIEGQLQITESLAGAIEFPPTIGQQRSGYRDCAPGVIQ